MKKEKERSIGGSERGKREGGKNRDNRRNDHRRTRLRLFAVCLVTVSSLLPYQMHRSMYIPTMANLSPSLLSEASVSSEKPTSPSSSKRTKPWSSSSTTTTTQTPVAKDAKRKAAPIDAAVAKAVARHAEATTENAEARQTPLYAYAFTIGGCDPNKPTYRNFLYNVLIAKEILQRGGSAADVVVFVQMSNKSNATELPEEDDRLLRAMDVRVRYVPKVEKENFYTTVMDKFRVLSLVQYRRVLVLDADVMPLGNLDYLFEMSDTYGVLKENAVVQGGMEPANAGFFMLTPYENAMDEINDILQNRTDRAIRMGHPYFDPQVGWGHTIEPPDQWEAWKEQGTNWTFWSAHSDQGLLYHWVKYHRKSVSIMNRYGRVDNWGSDGNGGVQLERKLRNPYVNFTDRLRLPQHCIRHRCTMGRPYSDFEHFTGRGKPWLEKQGPAAYNFTDGESARLHGSHYWFWNLHVLNERLRMGLNFSNWREMETTGTPTLGKFAVHKHALEFKGIRFSKTQDGNTSRPNNSARHRI